MRARAEMAVALVQMTSTQDRAANLAAAEGLVLRATSAGADLVALPENFLYLRSEGVLVSDPETLDGPVVGMFSGIARDRDVWILIGSIPERMPAGVPGAAEGKVWNTSVLIDRSGAIRGVYRKIHLFDVEVPGGPGLRESSAVGAGSRAVVVETEFGKIGLSICYDLRFPELYRRLVRDGAMILTVPSAFTDRTGRDHWDLLTRARAVENQCFLIAPAQTGRHSDRRASWGHTRAVDPWGRVVGELPEGTGLLEVTLDLEEIDRVRRMMPCLGHARPWLLSGEDGDGSERT